MRYQDFWGVYHGKLGFLQEVNERQLYIRTSTETRTFQVAGGMLYGMNKKLATNTFKVYTQPDVVSLDLSSHGPMDAEPFLFLF
jgi:2-phosphoxylose phosphatase